MGIIAKDILYRSTNSAHFVHYNESQRFSNNNANPNANLKINKKYHFSVPLIEF